MPLNRTINMRFPEPGIWKNKYNGLKYVKLSTSIKYIEGMRYCYVSQYNGPTIPSGPAVWISEDSLEKM